MELNPILLLRYGAKTYFMGGLKTAIYIEDAIVQLVLTPENDWEKKAFAAFHEKPVAAKFFNGEFYPCQGGYITCGGLYPSGGRNDADKASLIILKDDSSDGPR